MEIITVIPKINQSDLLIFISHIIDPVHGETVETMFRTSDFAYHISHITFIYLFIYLLTAIGFSPGHSTHLHTNNEYINTNTN
jgi:preprotein translocase subunit SecY